jgi:octaprenyl-diphosphate synthase
MSDILEPSNPATNHAAPQTLASSVDPINEDSPTQATAITFDDIVAPVKADFVAVDALIQDALASDVPLIAKINDYLINSGGKRLRPLIALLCGHINGTNGDARQHKLATAVEFLHNATLLHDDVVDDSDLRRGRKTTHTLWGNATSILVGDFLISRSLQLLTDLDHMPVLRVFAETTNQIAEGEVLQLLHCKNPDTTLSQYKEVVKRKTAKMFEAAARGAAMLAECDTPTVDALSAYALHLGNGFQMIDDALDYCGNAAALGKQIGDDIAEGKVTLPFLLALDQLDDQEVQSLKAALQQSERSPEQVASLVALVQNSGAVEQTRAMAKIECDKALAELAKTPAGTARTALSALAHFTLSRQH